jgi:transposase
MWLLLSPASFGGAKDAYDTTIALDVAKSVFQVHGIDAQGKVSLQLKRSYVLAFFQKLPPVPRWN